MKETNNKKRKIDSGILIPTIVMGIFALVLFFIGFQKGQGQHISRIKIALDMVIQILPLLIFSFIVAGMVQVLVPQEFLSKWIGKESGLRGIFIGTIAGAFAPGGPYTSLPIAVTLLKSGASIGTMVAFLTGWSLWAFARLPMEIRILGWKFTIIRIASTFFFPPIAGLIAQTFFAKFYS